MANNSIWYQVGVALRSLLGLDKRSGGQAPPHSQGPTPTLKPKASQRPNSPRADRADPAERSQPTGGERGYDSSPGQFGEGATRDVAADELRGAKLEYAPSMDGDPDPGEIVWTWVP
ncbi:MAG: hypothetical protein KA158_09460, partial [Leucobacter sp.]|nr:hypothetical protein [Leucobacter sp.]